MNPKIANIELEKLAYQDMLTEDPAEKEKIRLKMLAICDSAIGSGQATLYGYFVILLVVITILAICL